MLRRSFVLAALLLAPTVASADTVYTPPPVKSDFPAPAWGDQTPPTHCQADEKVWFSGYAWALGTIISVCGSQTMDGPDAWLQMRYGEYGGDVLRHPAKREGSLQAFEFSRYTRPRVTYLTLETTAEGLTYSLFDAYDADDPEATGGDFGITHANGPESSFSLTMSTKPMSLGLLEDHVPMTPFLK